jgi:hypothetical protein
MNRSRRSRPLRVLTMLTALLVAAAMTMTAGASAAPPGGARAVAADDHGGDLPAPVDPGPEAVDPGQPLPMRRGTVQKRLPSGATAEATAEATATALWTRPVELRALVLATDPGDLGLAPWRSTLDRVGAAYDVIHVGDTALTRDRLVDAAGTGRYNAVLLTSSALLMDAGGGTFVSGLDATEWNTLWTYEREFGVRQATLYASHGTWPEETCMRPVSEGGVDEAGVKAGLTTTGRQIFDYLNPQAQIPIQLSYVYRNSVAPGCNAQAVLTVGNDVLGVRTTTPDGREQLALSFSQNEHLLQSHLLTYGLMRWATRGLHLGEQRHYLKLDVDDYFNASDIMLEDGTMSPDAFRMTGSEAVLMRTATNALKARHPLAQEFKLTLAYNGGDAGPKVAANCNGGGESALLAASLCVKNDVEWINHTLTHPKMNFTNYQTSRSEIVDNRRVAKDLGLTVPTNVLKTGEYSGLGVYHPDPSNDIDPPTDFGLMASNPNLLKAAKDTQSKYLHGNMSFGSHVPDCWNCTIRHPMNTYVEIVPDWPTNMAYFSSTPGQETTFYNSFYGPNGKFPYWPVDQTYQQIIGHESLAALLRIAQGSIYSSTMHIPNLNDYGGGRSLAFDWLDAVVTKYEELYSVPLLTPSWSALAVRAGQRTSHFEVMDRARLVYTPATGRVSVTSPVSGTIQVSGARGPGVVSYGSSVITTTSVVAGKAYSWPVTLLP